MYARQVKWGATYIFKWEEGVVARQRILRNSIHYDCFDVENRNGYIMKALAIMGNLLKDDLIIGKWLMRKGSMKSKP